MTETNTNKTHTFGSFFKENWTLIAVLIYVISPIDIIPEAILPAVGLTDDVVVVALELARRWAAHRKK